MKAQSPALTHVQHVWNHVSSRSWQRFNGALRSALENAICSGMKFEEKDFGYMREKLRLGWWGGENMEWAYSQACGKGRLTANPTAIAALESYLDRDPFIWAESVKTPSRLYVGSEFTWEGYGVTVTSFNDKKKTLVACAYQREPYKPQNKLVIGKTVYFNHSERTIESIVEYADGCVAVRLSAKLPDTSRVVEKMFTISAEMLNGLRKKYDARRRKHEKAFAEAKTLVELEAAKEAASTEGTHAYRHFDLDILREAASKREDELKGEQSYEEQRKALEKVRAANLERWAAGEDVRSFITSTIRLRRKGDYIEVSNGNKVSVTGAKLAMAFVRRYRSSIWESNGEKYDVDVFPLKRISEEGVLIGCTLIPWPEVDRCESLIRDI